MANTSLTLLTQLVLQELNGCPDPLAIAQLQRVIGDFYTFTTGWRDIVGPYNVAQGVDTIALNSPVIAADTIVQQNANVQFVLSAWLYPNMGGSAGNMRQWLVPVSRKVVGNNVNRPSTYFMTKPDTLVMYPVPDQTYGTILYAYASLVPIPVVTQLPAIATSHHLDAIIAGTLAKLMGMSRKPWSDKAEAANQMLLYRRYKAAWRAFAERNYGPNDKLVLFPSFAGRQLNAPIGIAG